MDFIVGGMPRGGTTIAAKFMSLHSDIFCYAGETSLVPLLFDLFEHFPCQPDNLDTVLMFLRSQLQTTMIEMPRFSVSRGAHPANLIFNEAALDQVMLAIGSALSAGYYGKKLYESALVTLGEVIAQADRRSIIGEKTPNNVFALAEFYGEGACIPVLAVREPIGTIRSMRLRDDPYAAAFSGTTEHTIGIYLEYGEAILRCLQHAKALRVRYEDMAEDPALVLKQMFGLFGRIPEDRVIAFVEHGRDKEIADRAPMHYRRLRINTDAGSLSPVDQWKILALTKSVREAFGYGDNLLSEWGFELVTDWPGDEIPAVVLPLGGFHAKEPNGQSWMKKQGTLVAYMPKGTGYTVELALWSNFPESIGCPISLKVMVNGVVREELQVACGQQQTRVILDLTAADLLPVGAKGSYVVLKLCSSLVYAPVAIVPHATETRAVSFLYCAGEIKRRNTTWKSLIPRLNSYRQPTTI